MKKRIWSVFLALVLGVSLLPGAALADDETPADAETMTEVNWDISKSKTATNLDSNYESTVTLSLPSAEETLSSDIVFVLDTSDCVGSVMQQITGLVEQLKQAQESTKADIKIGVVAFKGSALSMFDGKLVSVGEAGNTLAEMADEVAQANSTTDKENVVLKYLNADDSFIYKGSNLHSGLMAAQQLLASDQTVLDSRKYVIAVTDGMTYYWNDAQGNVYGIYSQSASNNLNNPSLLFYGWQEAYGIGSGYALSDKINAASWDEYIAATRNKISDEYTVNVRVVKEKLGTDYSGVRFSTIDALTAAGYKYISKADGETVAHGIERSVIKCLDTYQEMVGAGYQCYAINPNYGTTTFPGLFTSKLNEMAGKADSIDFSTITNDILYAVGAGSTIVDEIGSTSDYNFDLVVSGDECPFTLTVGGVEYTAVADGTNAWDFYAPAAEETALFAAEVPDFRVVYENEGTEKFTWFINTNVSNFAAVRLTYTVKLTNPKAPSGTYGVYDEDGIVDSTKGTDREVQVADGIYTNNSAVLYPVDSNRNANYLPDEFFKPSVSYTVSAYGPVVPPESSKPALNTEDHIAYIIGYPEDYVTGEPTGDMSRWPVKPQGNITRAEVTTIFFRLLTDESRASFWNQTNGYTDVKFTAWYNNAVSTMTNAGIVTGYPDGSFRPDAPITRAEFAAIAARFSEVVYSGGNTFADVPENHWAARFIALAEHLGWIEGYPDGSFRPDQAITRAEAMTLINRVLERAVETEHMLPDMVRWADNPAGAWYYEAVQEATNSHEYVRLSKWVPGQDFCYEDWLEILPVPDWEALEKTWSTAYSK